MLGVIGPGFLNQVPTLNPKSKAPQAQINPYFLNPQLPEATSKTLSPEVDFALRMEACSNLDILGGGSLATAFEMS